MCVLYAFAGNKPPENGILPACAGIRTGLRSVSGAERPSRCRGASCWPRHLNLYAGRVGTPPGFISLAPVVRFHVLLPIPILLKRVRVPTAWLPACRAGSSGGSTRRTRHFPQRPCGRQVKTPPSQGGRPGANPGRGANFQMPCKHRQRCGGFVNLGAGCMSPVRPHLFSDGGACPQWRCRFASGVRRVRDPSPPPIFPKNAPQAKVVEAPVCKTGLTPCESGAALHVRVV